MISQYSVRVTYYFTIRWNSARGATTWWGSLCVLFFFYFL